VADIIDFTYNLELLKSRFLRAEGKELAGPIVWESQKSNELGFPTRYGTRQINVIVPGVVGIFKFVCKVFVVWEDTRFGEVNLTLLGGHKGQTPERLLGLDFATPGHPTLRHKVKRTNQIINGDHMHNYLHGWGDDDAKRVVLPIADDVLRDPHHGWLLAANFAFAEWGVKLIEAAQWDASRVTPVAALPGMIRGEGM
jgi:hypothetical protein